MEIIDLINELKDFRNKGFKDCSVEAILLKLKRIENDKKVKVPYFVADLIEYAKIRDWDLEDVFLNIANEPDTSDISEWFYTQGNMDVIARAWLDGYEIEKKRYLVKIIGITDYNSYLNYHKEEDKWTIESSMDTDTIRTKHPSKSC